MEPNPTILVIYHDPIVRDLISKFLLRIYPHYSLAVAEDGQHGVELTQSLKPAFIFADLNLPIICDYEVVFALHKRHEIESLPVFLPASKQAARFFAASLQIFAQEVLPQLELLSGNRASQRQASPKT